MKCNHIIYIVYYQIVGNGFGIYILVVPFTVIAQLSDLETQQQQIRESKMQDVISFRCIFNFIEMKIFIEADGQIKEKYAVWISH